ncbi:MAG: restriction endonuclease subunit S [Candidatus Marinimicrobia bacterium]|nr:restriction endonuclease subunit S [Candidatus Neomarinimicrobiota bacterium]
MISNYRKIGEFLERVNTKNSDGKLNLLLGINIDKYFMPSVANVVGTDLSKYKVVKPNQFSCNRMHVGRDKRLPIALSKFDYDFIVSPAYDVFEILDIDELNPAYLMMWFSRSEFDRNSWFYTDTDVRGKLGWDSLCDMTLPVPGIEKQQEIVSEYNTVVNRIKLNETLNQKLEETAQALYKHWFVDFEFPFDFAQGKANEKGKPYKSNGGKMVYNDELEKKIPEGWEVGQIETICEIGSSKRIYEYEYCDAGIPFYRGKEISLKKSGRLIASPIFISNKRYNELVDKYGKISHGDILMTAVGTIGSTYMVESEEFYFKDGNVIWFKNFIKDGLNYLLYDFMQSDLFTDLINKITIGSTQSAITIATFGSQKIIVPLDNVLVNYLKLSKKIYKTITLQKSQIIKLNYLQELLLSKMARVEMGKA